MVLAGIWINAMEFFRNMVLLNSRWEAHYQAMGLEFPAAPLNGAVWAIWAFVFAGALFVLTRRFRLWPATLLGWVTGFILMWLVVGNLQVLPYGILLVAAPMSFVEVLGAAFICLKLARPTGA